MGFDSMWKVVPVFGTFEARHAENEVLEQLYCYGVAGLILLCGLYGSLYRKIRKRSGDAHRVIFIGLLLFVVVRGLAEADSFDLLLPLWAIVLVTSLTARRDAVAQPAPVEASLSSLSSDGFEPIPETGHHAIVIPLSFMGPDASLRAPVGENGISEVRRSW